VHLGSSQPQSINQSRGGAVTHIITSQVRSKSSSLFICGKQIVSENFF